MASLSTRTGTQRPRTGLYYAAITALFAAIITAMAMVIFHNADGSVGSLIGRDLAAGNLLLDGWALSTQSYYFTDYLFNGLTYFVSGNLYFSSIATAVLLTLLGLCAAYLVAGLIYPKIPYDLFLLIFLLGCIAIRQTSLVMPCHYGTIAFCLFALYFFYSPRRGPLHGVLFVCFAAMAVFSDAYALAYAIAPLCGEVLLNFGKTRRLDGRIWLLGPVFGVVFLCSLIRQHFGFTVPGLEGRLFAAPAELPNNLALYFSAQLSLFKAAFWEKSLFSPAFFWSLGKFLCLAWLYLAHAAAFVFAARAGRALLLSSLAITGAFIFSGFVYDLGQVRYLTGFYVNGFIFSGLWGAWLYKRLPSGLTEKFRRPAALTFLGLTLGAILLFVDMRRLSAPTLSLIEALQKQGVSRGYAGYWNSHPVTMLTNGAISVSPVHTTEAGLTPFPWLNKSAGPEDGPATFLIIRPAEQAEFSDAVSEAAALQYLGPPGKTLAVGEYLIYLYDRDISGELASP